MSALPQDVSITRRPDGRFNVQGPRGFRIANNLAEIQRAVEEVSQQIRQMRGLNANDNNLNQVAVQANSWSGYLSAAIALLGQIQRTVNGTSHVNPVIQIAKNLTNKGLSEQASAYLEAAMVDSSIQGTPVNQEIILRKAQASTIHGDAETNIAYWKEVLNENKQLSKQTQDLAKGLT